MKSAAAELFERMTAEERGVVIADMEIEDLIALPYDALQSLDTNEQAIVRKKIAPIAWRAGDLSYLLDGMQRKATLAFKSAFITPPAKPNETMQERLDRLRVPISYFVRWPRGGGKSWTLIVHCIETALAAPNRVIYFVAPRREDAEKIVADTMNLHILADCPEDMKPTWKAGDAEYHFHNGSIIRFRGTNSENVERLRGPGAHLIILDEAGSMDQLKYVLEVVKPVVKRWGGHILIPTTPAKTTDHESKEVFEDHMKRGAATRLTMLDVDRWSWDEKAQILLQAGEPDADIPEILAGKKLPKTTYVLREYWCEDVTDTEFAVAPEYNADLERETTVKDLVPPPFRDLYVAMDPGKKDYTGILYAYVDFLRGKLVIEDESLLTNRDSNTDGIADEIRAKELTLWGAGTKVRTRVSDVELRLIEDLGAQGLVFETAEKKDSDAAIRLMRKMLTGQVEIHERCVELRKQLRGATWNNARTDFAHQPGGGHYDLVAALKYLCRTVDLRRNPYPAGWREERSQDVWRRSDVEPKKPASPATPLERKVSSVERVVGFAAKLMQGGRHVR